MDQDRKNLWAPWRMEYIGGLSDNKTDGCFLCAYRDDPHNDTDNLVLWRGRTCFVVFNRFPYSSGHMLIAPYQHLGTPADLDDQIMTEIMVHVRDLEILLRRHMNPEGFNLGANIGHCAGAGLPGHFHMHLLPRWTGDTNFMSVIDDVRVIPQSLNTLYAELRTLADEMHLPRCRE